MDRRLQGEIISFLSQRKLYEEQRSILGDDMHRDATFQELSEMKYLDLFIKEAQRVYPSVPLIGRYTEKDYDICKFKGKHLKVPSC